MAKKLLDDPHHQCRRRKTARSEALLIDLLSIPRSPTTGSLKTINFFPSSDCDMQEIHIPGRACSKYLDNSEPESRDTN
ncbi:hypothetical protein TNCT_334481 [Trichonephila clavata]|uniref:Uncharacterized protein n=2 Tax=Trichonephila TaxID=2585208 RepID=A0A8X6HWM5_TRICU|nr:hypothetical protein TNCT_334481 [Trichonephila clavata]GFY61354.1 hypothetical protein TNIN_88631 [Trichonephila inaurata madagascariensis]